MKTINGLYLFLLLVAMVPITGCSEGDIIPLIPPTISCERPLDQNWKQVNNIAGYHRIYQALWPSGQMPVVMGEDGLILENSADFGWSAINLPITDNLWLLSENQDGDLIAAGQNGTLVYRKNGNWQIAEKLTQSAWRDVRSDGREMWLAGDDGNLARGYPGGSWQMVDYPDDSDILAVCVAGDSVFVGGNGGLLRVLVDDQWHDISWPFPEFWGVNSIVRLDDGRLVVSCGTVWVRDPDGWHEKPELGYENFRHLKVRDGNLWVNGGFRKCWKADTSTEPWGLVNYSAGFNGEGFAPGPDDQTFNFSNLGRFSWAAVDDQGEVVHRIDPQGGTSTNHLGRLGDGTVIFSTDNSLIKVVASALEEVPIQSSYLKSLLYQNSLVAGVSLDDFYVVADSRLWRIVNGGLVLEEEIPDGFGSCRTILVNEAGLLCMRFSQAIFFWRDNQWEAWDEGRNNLVFLTRYNNFVAAFGGGEVQYHTDLTTVSLNAPLAFVSVWEPEPGTLEFMDRDFGLFQWKLGSENNDVIYLNPLPGCPNFYPRSIKDSDIGVLMASGSHSMVFRVPTDPHRSDWDLVAGPCLHELYETEVTGSGELVGLSSSGSTIMVYPNPGF